MTKILKFSNGTKNNNWGLKMFAFNNEYLLKSMIAMVRDEGKRIVSLGLATDDDLRKLSYPIIEIVSKSEGAEDVLLPALSILYNKLTDVKLPGDFEKVAGINDLRLKTMWPDTDNLLEQWILRDKEQAKYEDSEKAKHKGFKDEEKEEDEGQEQDAIDKIIPLEEEPEDEVITVVCAKLENLAYKLGMSGKHKAAYTVERTMQEIVALGNIRGPNAFQLFQQFMGSGMNPMRAGLEALNQFYATNYNNPQIAQLLQQGIQNLKNTLQKMFANKVDPQQLSAALQNFETQASKLGKKA